MHQGKFVANASTALDMVLPLSTKRGPPTILRRGPSRILDRTRSKAGNCAATPVRVAAGARLMRIGTSVANATLAMSMVLPSSLERGPPRILRPGPWRRLDRTRSKAGKCAASTVMADARAGLMPKGTRVANATNAKDMALPLSLQGRVLRRYCAEHARKLLL